MWRRSLRSFHSLTTFSRVSAVQVWVLLHLGLTQPAVQMPLDLIRYTLGHMRQERQLTVPGAASWLPTLGRRLTSRLRTTAGFAGSWVVGSMFMLGSFRAVPQLWRWAT